MCTNDPFRLDLNTVIAASPMMGHRLEDRSAIREKQDLGLVSRWGEISTIALQDASQQDRFVVAPLDVLVSRPEGRPQFHIIEMNGTGIGGITNMPAHELATVVESLRRAARSAGREGAVLLLAISGKESAESPRLNKLLHEKLIFAEAMADGLRDRFGAAELVTLSGLNGKTQTMTDGTATVVIGYIKELLDACEVDAEGRVTLHGRDVAGAVNDRFCLNLEDYHGIKLDPEHFTAINGTYVAGADKGAAYSLLDEYLAHHHSESFPPRVHHVLAHDREELIDVVLGWLKLGRRTVIKPRGTGIGHGIEFFLDPHESAEEVIAKIDESLRTTEEYYGLESGALPYTVCEFVDTAVIEQPEHRLNGHKFELRVVVYRDGMALKACPTIAKVAAEAFDEGSANRSNLINNITNSAVTRQSDGTEFMLPLCNEETLELLGLTVADLDELCRVATSFVKLAVQEIDVMEERMNAGCLRDWPEVGERPAAQRPLARAA